MCAQMRSTIRKFKKNYKRNNTTHNNKSFFNFIAVIFTNYNESNNKH